MTDKRKKPQRPKKPVIKTGFNNAANDDDGDNDAPPQKEPVRNLSFIRKPDHVLDASTGRTLLIDAILKNDPARAEILLKSGASVSKGLKDGRSPLHIAAATGCLWAIDMLAKFGAQPNARDKKMRTAFFEALSAPNAATTIKALADIGANAAIPDNDSRLPLHIAADSAKADVVSALLGLTENPNAPDKDGWHPFHFACRNNTADIVKLFIEKPVTVEAANNKGDTALHLAAQRADTGVAEYLLTTDAVHLVNAVNLDGRTPLHVTAAAKNTTLLLRLLNAGANINAHDNDGMTALHEAARTHNLLLARLLIKRGADVGKEGKPGTATPLHLAIRAGVTSSSMVDLLIDNHADVNARDKNGCTPLMAATLCGADAVCKRLLENGADPSVRDNSGRNVLFFISPLLRGETLKLLIDAGADVNARETPTERTPLMASLQEHKTGLARLLIDMGADLDLKNNNGGSALLYAMRYDHEPIALLLLKKGADPKHAEKETGVSPLHMAAALGFTDCLKLILAKGADIEARDYMGRTPLAYSLMNGLTSMDMLRELIKAGANPVNPDNKGTTPYDYAYGDNRTVVMSLFDQTLKKNNKPAYTPKRPPWRPW